MNDAVMGRILAKNARCLDEENLGMTRLDRREWFPYQQ